MTVNEYKAPIQVFCKLWLLFISSNTCTYILFVLCHINLNKNLEKYVYFVNFRNVILGGININWQKQPIMRINLVLYLTYLTTFIWWPIFNKHKHCTKHIKEIITKKHFASQNDGDMPPKMTVICLSKWLYVWNIIFVIEKLIINLSQNLSINKIQKLIKLMHPWWLIFLKIYNSSMTYCHFGRHTTVILGGKVVFCNYFFYIFSTMFIFIECWSPNSCYDTY